MHVKFGGTTRQTTTLKKLLRLQEKALRIIDFKPQASPSDCIFKKMRFLRSQTLWNTNMPSSLESPPLNLNHDHNTGATINHPLDKTQKQTNMSLRYGTYSMMVFTASKIWNDILRKSDKDLLYCELSAFKKTIFQRFSRKYENDNWNDWGVLSNATIHGGYYCSFCIVFSYYCNIQYLFLSIPYTVAIFLSIIISFLFQYFIVCLIGSS